MMDGLEGAVAHPADWADRGEVDYHHRDRTLLVRDADVERVTAVVPGAAVAHDNNVRGLTRVEIAPDERRNVEEACAHLDRTLGEGVATPDHVLYVCAFTTCPATEPEEVQHDAKPHPKVSAGRAGEGVLMVLPDSGLLPGAADRALVAARRHGRAGEPDRRLPAPDSSLCGPRDVLGRRRADHGAPG